MARRHPSRDRRRRLARVRALGRDQVERLPVQRCTVHKERNLLTHPPQHLHDEIKADFNDMAHAGSALEVVAKRKTFLGKWTLRCRAVAAKTECLLPCAETTAMLFWALLASGQITMRRVGGWQTLERSPADLSMAR